MFLVGSIALVVGACSDGGKHATPPSDSDAASVASTNATSVVPKSTTPEPGTTSSTTSTTTTSTPATPPPIELSADPFTLGVASGDPNSTSVVLWTRLAPDPLNGGGMPEQDVTIVWELSDTDDFATIVATGTSIAVPADGHSVHVTVAPPPTIAGSFSYRFKTGSYVSPVGRTSVAAGGAIGQATFVSASCQNYEDGYYTAHADIAAQRPDFAVWLGDYIYEGAG